MNIDVVNPATGQTLRTFASHSDDEVSAFIDQSHQAFLLWSKISFSDRSRAMHQAALILRSRSEEYARLMAEEMGKPIRDGKSEVEKCAWVCSYYADNAESFLANEQVATGARTSYVAFRPIGPVLAVMPWNFPFWQVIRFAAPALMAGNVALLKHASNVPGSALAIEEVFRDAGFPEGTFRTLLVGSGAVSRLIDHRYVAAVTLTGSTPAGRAVAAKAGDALKKTVLELGGSDPYIILADADLDLAAASCVRSRLINSGQSCIAAKRFIVVDQVRHEFEERFVALMAAARMGNPFDASTDVGPQARVDLRNELHDQVVRSISLGARLLLGGTIPQREGAWYPPTVLTDVRPGMPAFDEELFGPVAAIVPAADETRAVELANNSDFGLGAAVFTRNVARGEHIAANQLEAGSCSVNTFVTSDPRLPFGGIRQSGYGRELSSFGIREFVNVKSVVVETGE